MVRRPAKEDEQAAVPNPFNAGFGVPPPYVAGRAALLHRVLANLQDGPGRATYLQVLLGGRGVGKTVLLNEVRDRVTSEFGWAPIAALMGRETPEVSWVRDSLIKDHQLIYADARNSLRIALPGFADWLRHELGLTDSPEPPQPIGREHSPRRTPRTETS